MRIQDFPIHLPELMASIFGAFARISRQMVGTSSLAKMKKVLQEFWRRFRFSESWSWSFWVSWLGLVAAQLHDPLLFSFGWRKEHTKKKLCGFLVFTDAWDGALLTIYRGTSTLHGFIAMSLALNFVGQTWGTQLLIATMLREMSNENPEAMQTLLSLFASDAARLATWGAWCRGHSFMVLACGNERRFTSTWEVGFF